MGGWRLLPLLVRGGGPRIQVRPGSGGTPGAYLFAVFRHSEELLKSLTIGLSSLVVSGLAGNGAAQGCLLAIL